MKTILATILSAVLMTTGVSVRGQEAQQKDYLDTLRSEFVKRWPESRTVNIVFHGHSVPAGYARTPVVNTLEAYPHQTLVMIKSYYNQAIVNCITTAIGGEDSEQGALRFKSDVLTHRPDVVFIDYALNDRRIGLERSERAWRTMIESALEAGVKLILCTPTPDLSARLDNEDDALNRQAAMIRQLAAEYHVGLADFSAAFRALSDSGERLSDYMAQVNHPNARGHQVALSVIEPFFAPK